MNILIIFLKFLICFILGIFLYFFIPIVVILFKKLTIENYPVEKDPYTDFHALEHITYYYINPALDILILDYNFYFNKHKFRIKKIFIFIITISFFLVIYTHLYDKAIIAIFGAPYKMPGNLSLILTCLNSFIIMPILGLLIVRKIIFMLDNQQKNKY